MVVEADREGCLREVLVVAAALSIQDPRERPPDAAGAGRPAPRPVRRPDVGLPDLAEPVASTCASSSRRCPSSRSAGCAAPSTCTTCGSGSGRTCTASCGRWSRRSGSRVRLADERRGRRTPTGCTGRCCPACCRTSGCGTRRSARLPRRPRRAVRHLARARRWPRSRRRWVMAAELVETSRLWGRTVAPHRARVGRGAGRRTWSSAPTASRTGRPSAARRWPYERVTLYGVPLVVGRPVGYGRIDPELSRELFIRHALVEGDWRHAPPRSSHANRELLDERRGARAARAAPRPARRRRGAGRLLRRSASRRTSCPAATSTRGGRRPGAPSPTCSTFTRRPAGARRTPASGRPTTTTRRRGRRASLELPLTYQFEPGRGRRRRDRARPARPARQRAAATGFDWQVPGPAARAGRPR